MERRRFGSTDMTVSVLGFGGSEIGFSGAAVDAVARLLNTALDAGLNVIDTAECYMHSEEVIGQAVGHRRDEFFLFTKCGHEHGLSAKADWSRASLARSIDRSLQRLRTDRVDLVQLHSCDAAVLGAGEAIDALQRAKAAGKTRFIGYSGDGDAARLAVELGVFDALQTSLSIADQEVIDGALPLAAARGMGVIAKRPIANAAWRDATEPPASAYHRTYWQRLQALGYPFLAPPAASAASIALRFTLAQPGVHTAIVGTQNPERWRQNAALLDAGPLPPDQVRAIRDRWRAVAPPDWVGQT